MKVSMTIVLAGLVSCLAGCTPKPDPQVVARQRSEQAAARGREKFNDELVQKNVTWYVGPGQSFSGFDANTGLPEQAITAGVDETASPDFVRAHNEAVLKYMAQNGPVPGSFKAFENNIDHQAIYFDLHKDEQPQALRTGVPLRSPGGDYTLVVQRSGASLSPITQSPYQLIVLGPTGRKETAVPAGASEPNAEVLFAPAGSDLAFTRWPSNGGQTIYAALDLRDGRWLVVQRGQK